MPDSAFFYQKSSFTSLFVRRTSVPSKCLILDAAYTVYAGQTYSVALESRNLVDVAHVVDNDIYQVSLTNSSNKVILTETASQRIDSEFYDVTFVPTVAGVFNAIVTITNAFTGVVPAEISGSPYTLIVYPGPYDPAESLTSITKATTCTAGVECAIEIHLADQWGNLLSESPNGEVRAKMTV